MHNYAPMPPPLLPGGARVCWINSTSAHIIMVEKERAKEGMVTWHLFTP